MDGLGKLASRRLRHGPKSDSLTMLSRPIPGCRSQNNNFKYQLNVLKAAPFFSL